MINEIIKSLEQFITRDLTYITGGSTIIISFFYCYDYNYGNKIQMIFQIYAIAISYILGYVFQELFCFLHITRTNCSLYNPGWLVRKIYKLYVRKDLGKIKTFDQLEYEIKILQHSSKDVVGEYQRIITLKQIGTTIGPCLVIASIFICIRVIRTKSIIDIILLLQSLGIGMILISLGWLKLAQQCEYAIKICSDIDKNRQ